MGKLNDHAMCQALQDIDRHFGKEIFKNPERFRSAAKDFMREDTLLRERNILVFAANMGILNRLLQGEQCSKDEQERLLSMIRRQLIDDYCLQEDAIQCILNAFAAAFGFSAAPAQRQAVRFGPYSWQILREDADSALIITDEITDIGIPYHNTLEAVTWSTSSIRKWLNTTFYNRFSQDEQNRLLTQNASAEPNNWYGTQAGDNTEDRVSLLSIPEAVFYFGDSGSLSQRPDSLWQDPDSGRSCAIDDTFNTARRALYKGAEAWWWLRSPGADTTKAAYVNPNGVIFLSGELAFDDGGSNRGAVRPGVRPVVRIRQ